MVDCVITNSRSNAVDVNDCGCINNIKLNNKSCRRCIKNLDVAITNVVFKTMNEYQAQIELYTSILCIINIRFNNKSCSGRNLCIMRCIVYKSHIK
jgi:hypothetical protein